MNTSKPGRRGALSVSAALVVMTMLLGACSSNGTTADAERAAAAPNSDVELSVVESTEAESPESDEADGVGGGEGFEGEETLTSQGARVRSRVCVSNNLKPGKDRYWFRWDPASLIELSGAVGNKFRSGTRVCADRFTYSDRDEPSIDLYLKSLYLINIYYHRNRDDEINVVLRQHNGRGYDLLCLGEPSPAKVPVGYEGTWDDGWERFTIKRVPNSSFPEFDISIAPSLDPVPDSDLEMRRCKSLR